MNPCRSAQATLQLTAFSIRCKDFKPVHPFWRWYFFFYWGLNPLWAALSAVCFLCSHMWSVIPSSAVLAVPLQAQRVPGSLGSQISWQRHKMVVGCQPYAPAAFTPQEIFLLLISFGGSLDPRAIVRSERFYVSEKSTDTSWDRTSDLPICSAALNHCATAVPAVPAAWYLWSWCM